MKPGDARASYGVRRVGAWVAVTVIAAALPVLAQTSLLSRVNTLSRLASMPLRILGCAALIKKLVARRASQQEKD